MLNVDARHFRRTFMLVVSALRCSRSTRTSGGVVMGYREFIDSLGMISLEARASSLAAVPVTFRVGSHVWKLEPRRLGIRVDWDAAVDAVRRQGEGFGPLRGFRRLDMRFFGADVAPPTQVYDAALRYWLDRIERTVDTPHRDA